MSGSVARLLLKILVSGALLAFLLSKISVDEVARLLRTLDLRMMGVAVLIFLVSNFLGSLQWYKLLNASSVPISFYRAFRFYFVGLFFWVFWISLLTE